MKVLPVFALLMTSSLACLGGCSEVESRGALAQRPAAEPQVAFAVPSLESSSMSAGFASVDITWRAGAKPGQVGTEVNTVPMVRLWAGIIEVATTALRLQEADRGERLLRYATDWTLEWLEEEAADLPNDQYTDVFLPGRGIHTPSHAKAVVVESGGQKVAMVRVDLYLMQRHIHRRVAELVAEETGLTPENILISATHNHSAADAAHTAAGLATLSEAFDPRHFTWLTHKIAQGIIEADQNREPATMSAIRTTMQLVQRNIIGPSTGQGIPPGETEAVDVLAGYPRAFFDDDLYVVDFKSDLDQARLGSMVVFAMHPESLSTGHGMLSSDFVGGMEAGLEERWQAPVMWLPSGLGDVEPDDASNFGTDYWREDFQTLEAQVDELVNFIGAVLETEPLPSDDYLPARADLPVQSVARLLPGPPNEASPTDTAYQWPVTTYLAEPLPLASTRVLSESANLYLQVLRIGDLLFMGAPAEITTDLSKHLRSRVNDVEGDVWDGYLWEDNPAWVDDRVAENFTTGELSPEDGFAMPVLISQANDYTGYVVTRWEFENRHHYRKSMTLFGPGTADYIATRFQYLSQQLRGIAPPDETWDSVSELDLVLEQEVYDYVSGLDPLVSEFSSAIPFQDPWEVGVMILPPESVEVGEMGGPMWRFAWSGGSSDVGNPSIELQYLNGDVWTVVLDDSSGRLWMLYEKGGRWEAQWHVPENTASGQYRFVISGLYRGLEAGVSPIDALWDPQGSNVAYELTSPIFSY